MRAHGQVRIGTSGWIYRHWRGVFYPQDLPVQRWFAFYAKQFDTVEINNTFYRLPSEAAFDAWRKHAPADFLYAIKASRYLTHQKKLHDAKQPLENVLGRCRHLRTRLGPILYQLPPHWHCDVERLRQFIALLPAKLCHVFEFRDPSWFVDEIKDLLTATGMNFCIHDMSGQPSPVWTTGPAVYVRFHGPGETKYSGRYDRRHLRSWAKRMDRWRSEGRDVYAYFNNDIGGHAVTNARELQDMLDVAPATAAR